MRCYIWHLPLLISMLCGLLPAAGTTADGSSADGAAAMYVPWGHPAFTQGDECRYPWPVWGISACKLGGEWRHDLPAWSANPGETNALCLELDRDALQHDLALLLWYSGTAASVELFDADGTIVAGDVAGLPLAEGEEKLMLYSLPLKRFPSAVGILLGNNGALDVFGALLFEERSATLAQAPAAGPDVPPPAGVSASNASGDSLTRPLSGTSQPTPAPTIAASSAQVPGMSQTANSASQADSPAHPTLHIHAPHSGARILW